MIVIYHADCVDGRTAAWLVRRHFMVETGLFKDIVFIAAKYGDEIPDRDLLKDQDVWIVDFSYDPEKLVELCKHARMVTLCDHHESIVRSLAKYFGDLAAHATRHGLHHDGFPKNLLAHLDTDRSGTGIVWDVLYGHEERTKPLWLDHVQDRDLWRFKMPNTKAVFAAIECYSPTFESMDFIDKLPYDTLVAMGQVALEKNERMIEWHLKYATRMVVHQGVEVPLINAPRYIANEVADRLAGSHPYVIMHYEGITHRHVSLRSHISGDCYDGCTVNDIAEEYGGGGHRTAAGFTLPLKTRFFHKYGKWPMSGYEKQKRVCVRGVLLLLYAAIGTGVYYATKHFLG